jgi:glycerol-3-phosphate responsive antiterminator
MPETPGSARLPSILIASDGHHPVHAPTDLDAGVVVRDTDLATLVHRAASDCPPNAVDIDSIAGLGGDDYAVDFVTGRLAVPIVLTRRPQLAARAVEGGSLGLLHVFAYDSTGLRRSLEGHPRSAGVGNVGSVVTPGLVILHLLEDELSAIPRPILAYGLIDTVEDARACLAVADAIVIRPGLAAKLAAALVTAEPVGAGAAPA